MADDEHRAVAEALNAHLSGSGDWSKATPAMAEAAIAALDRVRDARGDDEAVRFTHLCMDCGALGVAGGYHDHGDGNAGDTIALAALPDAFRSLQQFEQRAHEAEEELAARSPQDEDHEA